VARDQDYRLGIEERDTAQKYIFRVGRRKLALWRKFSDGSCCKAIFSGTARTRYVS
jgi:hypothetical protein